MIYPTTNPLIIPKLMDLARALPEHTPLPELEQMLITGMTSAEYKLFIDEKDGDINGFIFGSIEGFDGKDACFVQACVVKPGVEEKHICFELLARMKGWAKEKQLEYIYFMTPRDHKSFERKYKFEFYATVLRKKVD